MNVPKVKINNPDLQKVFDAYSNYLLGLGPKVIVEGGPGVRVVEGNKGQFIIEVETPKSTDEADTNDYPWKVTATGDLELRVVPAVITDAPGNVVWPTYLTVPATVGTVWTVDLSSLSDGNYELTVKHTVDDTEDLWGIVSSAELIVQSGWNDSGLWYTLSGVYVEIPIALLTIDGGVVSIQPLAQPYKYTLYRYGPPGSDTWEETL